jgi:hypothetical protein
MDQTIILALYIVVLYYVTLPGNFITLPSASSDKMHQDVTHGVVFAAAFLLTYKQVLRMTSSM